VEKNEVIFFFAQDTYKFINAKISATARKKNVFHDSTEPTAATAFINNIYKISAKKTSEAKFFYKSFEGLGKLFQKFPKKSLKNC